MNSKGAMTDAPAPVDHPPGPGLTASEAMIEAIAERAAEMVIARWGSIAEPPQFLNKREVADALRSSMPHVDYLARRGRLSPVKDGGRTLYRRVDVRAYIERVERGEARQ